MEYGILVAIGGGLVLMTIAMIVSSKDDGPRQALSMRSQDPRTIKTKKPRSLPGHPGMQVTSHLGKEMIIFSDGKFDLTAYHVNDMLVYVEVLYKEGVIDRKLYMRILDDFTKSKFSETPLDREEVKQRVREGFRLDPCVIFLSEAGMLSNSEREYLIDTKIPEVERDKRFANGEDDGDDFDAVMAAAVRDYKERNA